MATINMKPAANKTDTAPNNLPATGLLTIHGTANLPKKIQPNTLLFINKNSVQQFDQNLAFDGKIILFTDHFFGKEESDTTFLKNTII